jgi:hypothetical protein
MAGAQVETGPTLLTQGRTPVIGCTGRKTRAPNPCCGASAARSDKAVAAEHSEHLASAQKVMHSTSRCKVTAGWNCRVCRTCAHRQLLHMPCRYQTGTTHWPHDMQSVSAHHANPGSTTDAARARPQQAACSMGSLLLGASVCVCVVLCRPRLYRPCSSMEASAAGRQLQTVQRYSCPVSHHSGSGTRSVPCDPGNHKSAGAPMAAVVCKAPPWQPRRWYMQRPASHQRQQHTRMTTP